MTEDNSKYLYPSVSYVQYDDYGGILRYGVMAKGFVDDLVTQGGNWLLDVSGVNMDMRVNVAAKTLEPKTECEAVVSGTTISNLPVPCKVFVAMRAIEVDDGLLELEFEQPGEYAVRVVSRTHMDGNYVVLA